MTAPAAHGVRGVRRRADHAQPDDNLYLSREWAFVTPEQRRPYADRLRRYFEQHPGAGRGAGTK